MKEPSKVIQKDINVTMCLKCGMKIWTTKGTRGFCSVCKVHN